MKPQRRWRASLLLLSITFASFLPALTDRQPHCLGHDREPALSGLGDRQVSHGVHHQECQWLQRDGQWRALIRRPGAACPLMVSMSIPRDGQDPLRVAYRHSFASRAPPRALT